MTTTPFAQLNVSVNGGGTQTRKVTVSAAQTIQLGATSTSGWTSQIWEIYDYPVGFNPAGAWSLGSDGHTWQNTKLSPDAFLTGSAWGKFMLRLRINGNPLRLNTDGSTNAAYGAAFTDEATILDWKSPTIGLEDMGYGETTQSSPQGFVGDHKANLRLLEARAGGAGIWAFPPGGAPILSPPTLPLAAAFTGVNLIGATLSDNGTTKALQVLVPGNRNAAANSRAYWYKTPPATPYTYTFGVVPTFGNSGTPLIGIMIRDSAVKFIEYAAYWLSGGSTMHMVVDKFTNPTTGSGSYRDLVMPIGGAPLYLQIVDHGAGNNLDFNYSTDGSTFLLYTTQARNDFLGATIDGIGIVADDISTVTGTNLAATVFDWTAA